MKQGTRLSLRVLAIFLISALAVCVAYSSNSSAQQCPPQGYPDYTVDCYNVYCCKQDQSCCSDAYGNFGCCEPGTVCCYDQQGYAGCCPSGQTTTIPSATTSTIPGGETTTTTIPSATTSTAPGGGTTTTTQGSGGPDTYLAVINLTGAGAQDSPQSSGTLPGTSPSEAGPIMAYEGTGRPMPLIIQDRFFPPLGKKLYEKTLEALQEESLSTGQQIETYAIGDVKKFWVKDDKDFVWRQVTATNKKEGAHSLIFVDNALNMADATLETYSSEFETMFTIISNNIGTFSDRDGNGKIIILIYDINDGATVQTGWLAGYFWSKDYINDSETQTQQVRSNETDMIYIRGNNPTGWTAAYGDFAATTLTTLIHEYQHMVHFGIIYWQPQLAGKTGSFDDTWINEMMSMASETMYFKKKLEDNPSYTHDGMLPGGYLEDRVGYYNKDPKNSIRNGHGLVYWDNKGDVFSNYSLAYIFGQYLHLQSSSGQGIFKEILDYMTTNSMYDYRAVEGVAKQRLTGIGSWEDLIKSWAVANVLNQASGLYGYKGAFSLTPHGPTSAKVTIHSGGVVHRILSGNWARPADAGAGITYCGFNSSGEVTCDSSGGATTTMPGNNCPPEYPVDCNNGYCCPSNLPVCGTGNNVGKCFRKGICVSSLMFGKDSYENNLLRSFRDQLLEQNSRGAELSNLYYQHTGELAIIIFGDSELYQDVIDITRQMIPAVESALQGSEITIGKDTENKINQVCDKIARKSSPDLRMAVEKVKEELKTGRLLQELGLAR